MNVALEGGCLCGEVRYVVRAAPVLVAWCHCASCRRSVGAPAVPWATFADGAFAVVRGKLAVHASSPGVRRGFCARCGTSLTYTADAMPGLVDVTVGSFDEPARLPPRMHIWERARVPWVTIEDGMPRHAGVPPRG